MTNYDATRSELVEIMDRLEPVIKSLPSPLGELAESYRVTLACLAHAAMGDAGCAQSILKSLDKVGSLSYHSMYHSSAEVNKLQEIADAAQPPQENPPPPVG
jgi:hypothetical protein